jgi:hypothetical protein
VSPAQAEPRPDGDGWRLVLPPGTQADRAEYYRIAGLQPPPAALYFDSSMLDPRDWTLADVRGTRVLRDGRQRFHVYRPVNGDVHAPLIGWSWPRMAMNISTVPVTACRSDTAMCALDSLPVMSTPSASASPAAGLRSA